MVMESQHLYNYSVEMDSLGHMYLEWKNFANRMIHCVDVGHFVQSLLSGTRDLVYDIRHC